MDRSSKDDFDPFNPTSKGSSDDKIQKAPNDDMNILYITVALIIALIVIWIIVVIMTKSDGIEILNEMSKPINQTKLANDLK